VSINVWRLAGDTLNITCNFLYCNHQLHRDFLITLYKSDKGKGKRCPVTRQAGTEGSYGYSSTHTQPRRLKGWVGGQRHDRRFTPAAHCTGGWVGVVASLDGTGAENLAPHRGWNPGPSILWRIAIPTELYRCSYSIDCECSQRNLKNGLILRITESKAG
jgi:hypothetical protein